MQSPVSISASTFTQAMRDVIDNPAYKEKVMKASYVMKRANPGERVARGLPK
jgi:hypothetical protein